MASIKRWLKDRADDAQGAYHQVNPFDGGRTFDTNQRQVNPGTQRTTPGFKWNDNSLTRGFSRGYDQINPLDSGRSWQTREPDKVQAGKSGISQTGSIIAPATGKFLNTAGLAGEQIWNTGAQFGDTRARDSAFKNYQNALKSGDKRALAIAKEQMNLAAERTQRTNQAIDDDYQRYTTPGKGIFGEGSFFHNAEEAASGDPAIVGKRIGLGTAETMFEVGSLGVGSFAGRQAVKTAGKHGVKKAIPIIAREQGARIAGNAVLNAGQGATNAANQDADKRTILNASLLSAGFGTLADVGLGVGGAVAPQVIKKLIPGVGADTTAKGAAKTAQKGIKKAGQKIAAEVTGNLERHPSVIALDETLRNLNTQRGKMIGGGMSENSPAVKANTKAYKLALAEKNKTLKTLTTRNQGGYLDIGAMADDAGKAAKKAKEAITGKTDEVPTTKAYGKTIEMTEKNGYKAIDTPDGNRIYTKVQTEGSNIKGTREPIQRWYTSDGTKLTRAQAEAYQTGALKQQPKIQPEQTVPPQPPKDTRQPIPQEFTEGTNQTRFTKKTVPGSPEVSDTVRKGVKEGGEAYKVGTDAQKIAAAKDYVKKKGIRNATTDIKERLNKKKFSPQTAADAIEVAKRLDARGTRASLQEATDIYIKLGNKFTEAGQEVQAASLISNRTPQGLKYQAIRLLDKAGTEVDGKVQAEIDGFVKKIKAAKPGSYEDGLARYRLMEYVAKKSPHSLSSKTVHLWKAGLLSGPRTTAGNLMANTLETIYKKGYADPVANVLDSFASLASGKRSRSMTFKGIGSGTAEGIGKGVSYFKTGYDPRRPLSKFDIKNIHYSDTTKGKVAEAYTQAVFRLMGAQDQPFYYANLRNSLADQAITEAKNKGLKGAAKKNFIKKFITEPEKAAMELADMEARYSVFQDETALGKMASKLKQGEGNQAAVAEFVMPFSGVPSSIATRIITRTPIGAAHTIIKGMRNGTLTQRALTGAIAEGTAVVPLVATGAALAKAGEMTLSYPTDKKERELWEADGRQPYSIKMGDKWLSLNYFQPGGTLIAAGAVYQDAIDKGEDPTDALATAVGGAGQAVTEQSFLKGVSGTLNAITDPERRAGRFVDQTAGSLTPNFIRSTASSLDPYQRQVNNTGERVKSTIPGLRSTLPVKQDMFGRDVERRSSAANSLLNPLRPSDSKNMDDPVTGEIRRLQGQKQGIVPTQLQKGTFYDTVNRTGTKLTDKQVQDFNAEVGREVQKEWAEAIKDPRYQELSDEDKKKSLDKINDTVYGFYKRKFEADNEIGEYAQDFDGKETKLNTLQQRYAQGKNIDYLAANSSDRTRTEEYEYQRDKLQEDKDSLNEIEYAKREGQVRKLNISKDYDEIVTDLYDLNKGDAYDFVTGKGDEGNKLFEKAVEYGDKLVEAGLIDKNKYRDKYGNISLGKKGSGGSKAKKPWQAPGDKISLAGSGDNRALISSIANQIKAPRLRRKF